MPVAYVHVRQKRTYVRQLAKVSCYLAKYIVKHRSKLNTAIAADATAESNPAPGGMSVGTCLDTLTQCLTWLCGFLESEEK